MIGYQTCSECSGHVCEFPLTCTTPKRVVRYQAPIKVLNVSIFTSTASTLDKVQRWKARTCITGSFSVWFQYERATRIRFTRYLFSWMQMMGIRSLSVKVLCVFFPRFGEFSQLRPFQEIILLRHIFRFHVDISHVYFNSN